MYVADFETTTDPDDCRVWAWAVCEVGQPLCSCYGNSIESFMDFVKSNPDTYYFHNLAFDGEFIIHHLLSSGFSYCEGRLKANEFDTLISDTGKYYKMRVCFERKGRKRGNVSTFKDSLKKLPMGVDAIAKAFHLPISKLSIDYDEYREPGHELTREEVDYVLNDVRIVAMALQVQEDRGLTKLTLGSDALNDCREFVGFRRWNNLFPELTLQADDMIRKAYRGGYTYCNPKTQADEDRPNLCVGNGSVYDVNSMYPSVMSQCELPVGLPVWFDGRYETDGEYPLHVSYVTAYLKSRENRFPTLQIKRNPYFRETEYITDTEGYVELAVTNVDLEVLEAQYEMDILSYNGGFKFRCASGVFDDYIDYWMRVKATTEGGERTLAKLMLNSLYGKFATNPHVQSKVPFMRDDGSVGYSLMPEETRKPVYTPVGVFVTSYARKRIIEAIEHVHDRFCYCDTDSIHLTGWQPVSGMEVHPTRLGAWKHESDFDKAKYVRAKTYMERIIATGKMVDGKYEMVACEPTVDVKCAGLPDQLRRDLDFESFRRGLVVSGKLRPRHVKGGIILETTDFTLT
jgi:hypothetical protein